MADLEIRKIHVGNSDYDIGAKYILDNTTPTAVSKTWTDIVNLVNTAKVNFLVCSTAANTPKGVTFTPKGSSTSVTGTLEAAAASTTTFYLVYNPDDAGSAYDEYVSTGTAWELIGTTKVDLSGKVDKGTYTTSQASGNTGEGGAQEATVSGSITYTKAATITGSAGGATIQGSNFSFTGTKADLTLTKEYQPAGTVSKPGVNLGGANEITYVNGVKSTGGTTTVLTGVTGDGTADVITAAIKGLSSAATTSEGAIKYVESFTHSGASLGTPSTTTVLTGVTYDGSDTAIKSLGTGSFFNGATVTNNVLSFTSGNAYNSVSSTFTAIKGVKANGTATVITGYPNFAGGGATPTTKYLTGTAATAKTTVLTGVKGDGTATVILSSGLNTATFNNYTSAALASTPTFTGTTATLSLSTEYTPAGSIGGSVTIPGHTHSVGSGNATATHALKAAVTAHTHSLGNHTHSVDLNGN